MDITKIKQLVKQNSDKFIFIENGEPEFVMMSYQEYEKFPFAQVIRVETKI